MSRTATCFFALGICVAMAAACGDDDGGGDGGGGSGGTGGQGGSAGSGGSAGNGNGGGGDAGSGPVGGAAGQTNVAGSSGVAGSGTAGSGTAGSGQAGAGTVPPIVDAGPDGSVESDASVPPPDSGPSEPADSGVNGDCAGFTTGIPNINPQNSQDVVIARVIFNNDGETATAVLRVINAFTFGGDQVLCWGSSNSECALVDDGIEGNPSPVGAEIFVTVGNAIDPIDATEGELLFAADTPQTDPAVFGYVNWGDHVSADVDDAGPLPTLEGFADAQNFWTIGESVDLDGNDNAFFGLGDTDVGTGFAGCTADQF
jgi:hypothetical protein